jgi:hypothetical protein
MRRFCSRDALVAVVVILLVDEFNRATALQKQSNSITNRPNNAMKEDTDLEATSSDDEGPRVDLSLEAQKAKQARQEASKEELQECRACLKPGRAWHCCDVYFCVECYCKLFGSHIFSMHFNICFAS